MSYQNQGLPVPVQPVNPQAGMGMQGLPYQPPFVVPAQVALPALQQMLPTITGCVLAEVLNNAQKNQLRSFHVNMLSQNGWQTRELQELVQQTAWIAEFLIVAQNMQPQQAIPAAANEAVTVQLGNMVSAFQHQLGQFITTQALADNLNMALDKGRQWTATLQQFHQQMAGQMGGGGMHGGGMPMMGNQYGGGVPMTGGYPPPRPGYNQMNRGGGGGMPMMGMHGGGHPGMHGGGGGYPQANRPNTGGMFAPVGGTGANPNAPMMQGMKPAVDRNKAQTNEMLSMEPGGGRKLERWNSGDGQYAAESNVGQSGHGRGYGFASKGPGDQIDTMPTTQNNQPQFQVQNQQNNQQSNQEWPKFVNPERPWEGFDLENGTQVRPAAKSGWKVTLNEEQPYRTIYDPTQFVLYHIRQPDGTVAERLEPRTDEMNYIDHETDPALREQERKRLEAKEGTIVPNWPLAHHLRTVKPSFNGLSNKVAEASTGEPDTSETIPEVEAPVTRVAETITLVHTLKEAELKLGMFARTTEGLQPQTPVEMQFDLVTPLITDVNLIKMVSALETLTSYEELQAQLQENEDAFPADVQSLIDTRLTAAVNQTLQQNFSLDGWSIDSFRADYVDLLKALEDKGGSGLVERFEGHAPVVIGGSLSVLKGESYGAFLKTLSEDERTAEFLVFRDRCSITQVPWNFADMNIDLNGGGMIPEASMPELHKAAVAIFERTEDFPVTFTHRYLQTADKKLIELRQGYLGSDAFLMFDVKQSV